MQDNTDQTGRLFLPPAPKEEPFCNTGEAQRLRVILVARKLTDPILLHDNVASESPGSK